MTHIKSYTEFCNENIKSGYVIVVTPKNKNFKKHIWSEGGIFTKKDKADFQKDQLKKTKMYTDINVVPLEKLNKMMNENNSPAIIRPVGRKQSSELKIGDYVSPINREHTKATHKNERGNLITAWLDGGIYVVIKVYTKSVRLKNLETNETYNVQHEQWGIYGTDVEYKIYDKEVIDKALADKANKANEDYGSSEEYYKQYMRSDKVATPGDMVKILIGTFNWPKFHGIVDSLTRTGDSDYEAEVSIYDDNDKFVKKDNVAFDYLTILAKGSKMNDKDVVKLKRGQKITLEDMSEFLKEIAE
jgi:hypothetical protein